MPHVASLIADLNLALDEATVQGIRWNRLTRQVRVMLKVLALPAHGPASPDARRLLVLSGVSAVRVLLRRDRDGAIGYGPSIPLLDQQSLEDFFASLAFADAMYDGKALDDSSPTDDWPTATSLADRFRAQPGTHTFYWFTQCQREEPGGMIGYLLEGVVRFDVLAVQRADGSPITTAEFVDDGRRWWAARQNNDPRVSARTQRELPGPSWLSQEP